MFIDLFFKERIACLIIYIKILCIEFSISIHSISIITAIQVQVDVTSLSVFVCLFGVFESKREGGKRNGSVRMQTFPPWLPIYDAEHLNKQVYIHAIKLKLNCGMFEQSNIRIYSFMKDKMTLNELLCEFVAFVFVLIQLLLKFLFQSLGN